MLELQKMIYIHNKYLHLQQEAKALDEKMIELKRQGITDARPYWMRKDDPTGKPDQLELTHPTDSEYYKRHNTRREYIGVKPERIKAALDSIDRWHKYQVIQRDFHRLNLKLKTIERQFKMLEIATLGEQSRF